MDVLKQCGCTDCGLFELAFGTSLYKWRITINKEYSQRDLRAHLYSTFDSESSTISIF